MSLRDQDKYLEALNFDGYASLDGDCNLDPYPTFDGDCNLEGIKELYFI